MKFIALSVITVTLTLVSVSVIASIPDGWECNLVKEGDLKGFYASTIFFEDSKQPNISYQAFFTDKSTGCWNDRLTEIELQKPPKEIRPTTVVTNGNSVCITYRIVDCDIDTDKMDNSNYLSLQQSSEDYFMYNRCGSCTCDQSDGVLKNCSGNENGCYGTCGCVWRKSCRYCESEVGCNYWDD